MNQTVLSSKQFGTMMGQPNFTAFNKWKKVWVAGFLEKKHRSIIQGQNCSKQLQDRPLHWQIPVADMLRTFEMWLRLENFNNAKWIWWQWVEMVLKKCEREVWEARKKGGKATYDR
jgi:hypothetical protein